MLLGGRLAGHRERHSFLKCPGDRHELLQPPSFINVELNAAMVGAWLPPKAAAPSHIQQKETAMPNRHVSQLFNIDSLLEELSGEVVTGDALDLFVASLAFKNFDGFARRLPFVLESVTYQASTWQTLVAVAPEKFWIRQTQEAVLVFSQTEHCGCVRTYRYRRPESGSEFDVTDLDWCSLSTPQVFYEQLDTPAAASVFYAWEDWMTRSTAEPTALANGRFDNTGISRSMIFTGVGSCLSCRAPAVGSARTTLSSAVDNGLLIQLPLCAQHLQAAQSYPCVARFLETLFSISLELPQVARSEAIPDALIASLHAMVAEALSGSVGTAEKRRRGWLLRIALPGGWHWLLRLNTLMDYAYMLYKPGASKEVYRADSAPDHPDLPFFPDHEHEHPSKKNERVAPSFLYGNPLLDLKRLRTVEQDLRRG